MEMGMRYLEDLFFCSSETKSFRIILISTISIFLNSRLLFLSRYRSSNLPRLLPFDFGINSWRVYRSE